MREVSCHCGAVSLQPVRTPGWVKDCNCSICRKLGVLWAYFEPAEVSVRGEDATGRYSWGDRLIAFHHCATCGCATHWRTLDPNIPRMGVNARLFPPDVLARLRVRRFDGAATWTFLDEAGGDPSATQDS